MFAELPQAELANVRIRAAEWSCTSPDASRCCCSSRDPSVSLSPDWQPCSGMHVCRSCPAQSDAQIRAASWSRSRRWGTESGVSVDDGVGERRVWWLNNTCGVSSFVWSQDWSPLLWWWCWRARQCRTERFHTNYSSRDEGCNGRCAELISCLVLDINHLNNWPGKNNKY